MLLANAFVRLLLGRDWRIGSDNSSLYRRILSWFADKPGVAHPYSIHNIAQIGTLYNKQVGDWFSPTIMAKILSLLVRKFSNAGLTFYLAHDRVIYRENVHLLCKCTSVHEVLSPRFERKENSAENFEGTWRPVIIMACVR